MARKWLCNGVLAGALSVCVLGGSFAPCASARDPAVPDSAGQVQGVIATAQLPREAVNTLNLIAAGGPYPYEKDGVVFGNYERVLPAHQRGYYHEYTVPTPYAHNRGARRVVCGGALRQLDNCYYSDDHYTSFKRIIE